MYDQEDARLERIAKYRQDIKEKFQQLKRNKHYVQKDMSEIFKPITTTLKELVEEKTGLNDLIKKTINLIKNEPTIKTEAPIKKAVGLKTKKKRSSIDFWRNIDTEHETDFMSANDENEE